MTSMTESISMNSPFKFYIQNDVENIKGEIHVVKFLYEKYFISQNDTIEWNRIRGLHILTEKDFDSLVSVNKKIRTGLCHLQKLLDLPETCIVTSGRRNKRSNDESPASFTAVRELLHNISNLTWTYINYTNVVIPDKNIVRASIHDALNAWKKAFEYALGENGMGFREVLENADIKVSFHVRDHSDGYPFDGQGNILAHAFYPGSSRSGTIHLDFEEDWDKNFLFNVLLHELGHTFGLGHSATNTSAMYSWYKSGEYSLDQDDFNGIFDKYHNKSIKVYGPVNPPTPTPTPTTTPTTTTTTTPTPKSTVTPVTRSKVRREKAVVINRDLANKSVIYIFNSTVYIK